MLLLGSCCGGCGGLGLRVLLLQTVSVRLLMWVLLPICRRVLVLVREDVLLRGQHGRGGDVQSVPDLTGVITLAEDVCLQ